MVSAKLSNLHGLSRSLIANMVKGVSDGWSKTLELSEPDTGPALTEQS